MNENNMNLSISVSVSIILTSELNQLRKDNETMINRISDLLNEKELLQKTIISKYT